MYTHKLLDLNKFRELFKKLLTEKYFLLFLIIFFHLFFNYYWERLNTAPPTWDSAGHLSLAYIFADKIGALFRGVVTFSDFLRTSTYYPPLVQTLGGVMILIFGRNYEIALLLETLFLIMGMVYLYLIVLKYFEKNYDLALLTVLIFSFFPQVWEQSRLFHLDVPLCALVLAAAYHLISSDSLKNRKHTILFFVFFSLAQLTKWYGFIYLAVPFFYEVVLKVYKNKDFTDKKRIHNLMIGVVIVILCAFPWYIENYKSILENARIASTADAGDPQEILSYESLFHYLKLMTSHQIGIVSVALLFLSVILTFRKKVNFRNPLALLAAVPYLVFTFIQNKDLRYILPLTPIFAFYIAYLLLDARSKFWAQIRSVLFAGYLIGIYFFLSFNQFTKLPSSLSFLATAIAGSYRYTWVEEPYAYAYNSQDWRVDEIVKKVQQLADEKGISKDHFKVLELSDNRYYAIADFDLYKLQDGFWNMDLVVPYYRFDPLTPDELTQYLSQIQFAIVPNNPGPSGLRNIAVLNQLVKYFSSDTNKEFEAVAHYDMPDKNFVTLYQRTNPATVKNPNLRTDSLEISIGNILFLDREKIGDLPFTVTLVNTNGVDTSIRVSGGPGERRISLDGIDKFSIDLPVDQQNIIEARGWTFVDNTFVRDVAYAQLVKDSNDEFVYENHVILPRTKISPFESAPDVLVENQGTGIKIFLENFNSTASVSYAVIGWQWNSVELNAQNREVTIPIEGLLQLHVTQQRQLIKDFTQNWGFYPCYEGYAVCFYPLAAGL